MGGCGSSLPPGGGVAGEGSGVSGTAPRWTAVAVAPEDAARVRGGEREPRLSSSTARSLRVLAPPEQVPAVSAALNTALATLWSDERSPAVGKMPSGPSEGRFMRRVESQASLSRDQSEWFQRNFPTARLAIDDALRALEGVEEGPVVLQRAGVASLLLWTHFVTNLPAVRLEARRGLLANEVENELQSLGTATSLHDEMRRFLKSFGTRRSMGDREEVEEEGDDEHGDMAGSVEDDDEDVEELDGMDGGAGGEDGGGPEHLVHVTDDDEVGSMATPLAPPTARAVSSSNFMPFAESSMDAVGTTMESGESADAAGHRVAPAVPLLRGGVGVSVAVVAVGGGVAASAAAMRRGESEPLAETGARRGAGEAVSRATTEDFDEPTRTASHKSLRATVDAVRGSGLSVIDRRNESFLEDRLARQVPTLSLENRQRVLRILRGFGSWETDVWDVRDSLGEGAVVLPIVAELALFRSGFLHWGADRGASARSGFGSFRAGASSHELASGAAAAGVEASSSGTSHWKLEVNAVRPFLTAIANAYRSNPYHNEIHAADITHTAHCLMLSESLFGVLPAPNRLALLLGAAVHDVGHPGTNTAFEVDTRSELATRYNDRAPLENMHAAFAWTLLRDPSGDYNALTSLSLKQRRMVREVMLTAILHTDMALHFGMLDDFDATVAPVLEATRAAAAAAAAAAAPSPFLGAGSPLMAKQPSAGTMQSANSSGNLAHPLRSLAPKVTNLLLHAADVSNPMKPLRTYRRWAEAVQEEFWQLGDRQRALSIPISANCDRNAPAVATCQLGFIRFIVKPLFDRVLQLLPERAPAFRATLDENIACYQRLQEIEQHRPSAAAASATASGSATTGSSSSSSSSTSSPPPRPS